MHTIKPSRGRPKGTGLNDDAQLRAIAGLITSNPDLRPTTAIRSLGIQDPSIIRRLRDKYQACEAELMSEMAANVADGGLATVALLAGSAAPREDAKQMPRAMPLAAPEVTIKSQPVKASPPKLSPSKVAAAAKPSPTTTGDRTAKPASSDMPDIMGIGLSLMEVSLRTQIAFTRALFQVTTLQAVLESQISMFHLATRVSQSAQFPSAPSSGATL